MGAGNLPVVQELVDSGADIEIGQEPPRVTPLLTAIELGRSRIALLLLEKGARIEEPTPLLERAIQSRSPNLSEGRMELAYLLVTRGASLSARNGARLLEWAVERGDGQKVELLLAKGVDPNAKGSGGQPILFSARGNLEVAAALVRSGADPNYQDLRLVHRAAQVKRTELAELFLEHGAPIRGDELVVAAIHGDTDFVRLLIAHGAEVNWSEDFGESAFLEAAKRGLWGTMRVLLEHGAGTRGTLFWAANQGDADLFYRLLELGADVNARNHSGLTPLLVAALKGPSPTMDEFLRSGDGLRFYVDVVRLALASGADVNARGPAGATALVYAAHNGDVETLGVLLAHGANVNVQDDKGRTALHYATSGEIARLLMENAADVDVKDNDGIRALQATERTQNKKKLLQAVRQGTTEEIKRSLKAGASIETTDEGGKTTLLLAAEAGQAEAMRVLMDAGADPAATWIGRRSWREESAMDLAIRSGSAEAVRVLLEIRAELPQGWWNHDPEVVRAILADCLERGTCRADDFLLKVADKPSVVAYLLSEGADPNLNSSGWTPLMHAVSNLESVRLLIASGADIHAKNDQGQTALDIAEHDGPTAGSVAAREYAAVAELLRQAGSER